MMEKCMSAKSRICKCYIVYEREISRAKRLFRMIESLDYKAYELEA